ncbi:MAG: YjbF family lipoprotein [Alphaproteobacteria bacterium]|nr:YjbF family lipoprotein [Alphaproteobacteria bacterium]
MKFRLVAIFAALLIVAGCASKDRDTALSETLKTAVKSFGKTPDNTAQNRAIAQMTRADLIGTSSNPLILLFIEISQQYASLAQVSQNGQYAVFFSSDQKSLTFSKGLLTATRGLGPDVLSLDVTDTRAALKKGFQGKVSTRRIHRQLNAENEAVATIFSCKLNRLADETVTSVHKKFRLERYEESCVSRADASVTYTNTYWLDGRTRVMWKSRQWMEESIGYLQVDVLIPELS